MAAEHARAAAAALPYPRFNVQCCEACPLRGNAVAAVVPLFAVDQYGLTTRELGILHLIAEGHANKVIARQLSLAEQTVKFHVTNITRKLRLSNRTAVAVWAVRNGLA